MFTCEWMTNIAVKPSLTKTALQCIPVVVLMASPSDGNVMTMEGSACEDRCDLSQVTVNSEFIFHHECTSMSTACMDGNLTEVKRILGDLPEQESGRLLTESQAFHHAIFFHHLNIVEYLACHPLTNLEEISPLSFGKPTPLLDACLHGECEAVEILLKHGADPNRGAGYSTPLMLACATRSEYLVELLLEHGADPNLHPITGTRQDTSLPLYVACLTANLKVVETLIEHLNKKENCFISSQQMILCRSLLGFRLLFPCLYMQEAGDVATGWTILRSAIDEFEKTVRATHGSINQLELSRILHKLYLRETYLVQTGKELELQGDPMFRTRARFPDFKLCMRGQDINVNTAQPDEAACRHFFLMPVASSINQYLQHMTDKSCDRLVDRFCIIDDTRMTKEDTRLCLLLLLENTLNIHEELNLLNSVFLNKLMSTIVSEKLFEHNPGYLMLVLDIFNCAVETISKSTENVLGGTISEFVSGDDNYFGDETQKDRVSKQLKAYTEMFGVLTYLIIREDLTDQHTGHLAKIVNRYTSLIQKMGALSGQLQCHLLFTIGNMLVSENEEFIPLQEGETWVRSGLKLMQSILRCGVDANSRDIDGNTVAFFAVGLPEPLRGHVIELLMAYGGHIDVANFAGNSPYQILARSQDSRTDIMSCRTLKCRAATTVTFFKIPYVGKVPESLEEFVTLHEMYTPRHVADVNKAICSF